MLTRLSIAGVLVVGALTLPASPTWAQNKCQGAKVKAAEKLAACILGGEAKVLAKGGTFDPSTCQSKFATAWGKLEAKGGCATNGDLSAIQNMVDSFAADVTTALAGTTTTTTATTSTSTTTTTTTLPTCTRLATLDCTSSCFFCGQAFCTSQGPTGVASCQDIQGLCSGTVGCNFSTDCAAQCLDCDTGQPCQ